MSHNHNHVGVKALWTSVEYDEKLLEYVPKMQILILTLNRRHFMLLGRRSSLPFKVVYPRSHSSNRICHYHSFNHVNTNRLDIHFKGHMS